MINDIRAEVELWRARGYPGVTSYSRKLMQHWAPGPHRDEPVLLVVSSLNPSAVEFYKRFGMTASPTNPLDLMITAADIEASMWLADIGQQVRSRFSPSETSVATSSTDLTGGSAARTRREPAGLTGSRGWFD